MGNATKTIYIYKQTNKKKLILLRFRPEKTFPIIIAMFNKIHHEIFDHGIDI